MQLLRVLIENNIGPILVMAFTNHAVDHLIRSVLDSKITSQVVRLGSHSADESIASRSLENLEKIAGESRLRPALNAQYGKLKGLEEDMMALMNRVTGRWVPSWKIMDMLEYDSPEQLDSLNSPPAWIQTLYKTCVPDGGRWKTVGGEDRGIKTPFDYWYRGLDIDFLLLPDPQPTYDVGTSQAASNRFQVLQPVSSADKETNDDDNDKDSEPDQSDIPPTQRWRLRTKPESPPSTPGSLDDDSRAPSPPPAPSMLPRDAFLSLYGALHAEVPTGERKIEELDTVWDVWSMSKMERGILGASWIRKARLRDYEIQRAEFERVKRLHKGAQDRYNELKDEVSRPSAQVVSRT